MLADTLALSALLWTTNCHSSRTEMLNISMLCINMLYALITLPLSLSANAAAAAKLCIECISKDRPQSGCKLAWLKQV